jgi:hypothetical protein
MKNLNMHKKLKRNYSEWHSFFHYPVPPLFITLGKCKIFYQLRKVSGFLWGDCLVGWIFLMVVDMELQALHILGV